MSHASQRTIEFRRGQCVRLANAGGTVVGCRSGVLWVTRDGSTQDIVLAPGETRRIKEPGLLIVSAFEAGSAFVQAPVRARTASARSGCLLRIAALLRGAVSARRRYWISCIRWHTVQ